MKKDNPFFMKDGDISRRSFIKISGFLGLGLATSAYMPAAAEAVRFNRKLYKVSKTRLAMGTFVSMTLVHSSVDQAERAIGLAFDEIGRLTKSLNRFDETTAVAHLNSEGFIKEAPPELNGVISSALGHNRMSGGAFDITVKPVVDLFKEKFEKGDASPPEGKDLLESLKLVGSNRIITRGRSIGFKTPGMGITLDGIAKGFIVDRAAGILEGCGIKNYLINAGGDIRTKGERQDRKPWAVAIQDPEKKGHYPDIINMTDGAIATSGNYEIYFDREKMFHHIVDPRKGISPQLSSSVSVVTGSAMDADALSTSVFVMGPVEGIKFLNNYAGCEGMVLDKAGRKFKSEGWRSAAI